ncbi:hypothetical protein [Streptomyces boluensis]|uniref:Uncharacterized protein n=1 Tax=Streptomyces boluensis TaxID=1775135 RepID=A0A964USA7_9ACTN|nr:hypothetical protein [Streptomyces boluensis]NBE53525.1 hypothetical protein [Streptomyces boluensis]
MGRIPARLRKPVGLGVALLLVAIEDSAPGGDGDDGEGEAPGGRTLEVPESKILGPALWARAECAAGRTYHQVSATVTPPPPEGRGFSLCRVGFATDQPGP